ncbi:hypothetical protein ACX8Z9_12490 [Arthrobacter halodurans]|uniref:Prolyl oligopeptidase family protein n=1 Tax=Arthrobacter halodurans TaxID=516699 RepID=A0ABV4UM35_9MICC
MQTCRRSPKCRHRHRRSFSFTAHTTAWSRQSEQLAAALNDAGVDHHLVLIDGAQHRFDMIWGTLAGQAARAEVVNFLEEYVMK